MCKVGEELRIKTSLSAHSRQAFLGGSHSKTGQQGTNSKSWKTFVPVRRLILVHVVIQQRIVDVSFRPCLFMLR